MIFNGLSLGKQAKIMGTLCQSRRGYVCFSSKLNDYQNCSLSKLVDTFLSIYLPSFRTNTKEQNDKNNSKTDRRDYKNLGLILSSFGLLVAFCEGPTFTRGKRMHFGSISIGKCNNKN